MIYPPRNAAYELERLAKWCKQHGYEVVPVLHDAIDMLDLELEAK